MASDATQRSMDRAHTDIVQYIETSSSEARAESVTLRGEPGSVYRELACYRRQSDRQEQHPSEEVPVAGLESTTLSTGGGGKGGGPIAPRTAPERVWERDSVVKRHALKT